MSYVTASQAYLDAPYELIYMNGDKIVHDPWPQRFNEPPPPDIWLDPDKFRAWVDKNSVTPLVQIND